MCATMVKRDQMTKWKGDGGEQYNHMVSLDVSKARNSALYPPEQYYCNKFNKSIKLFHLYRNLVKGGKSQMLFSPKEKGQGLVEYALILVLVAIVVIVVLALLGPAIGNIFSTIMASL